MLHRLKVLLLRGADKKSGSLRGRRFVHDSDHDHEYRPLNMLGWTPEGETLVHQRAPR